MMTCKPVMLLVADEVFISEGTQVLLSAPQTPRMNAIMTRWGRQCMPRAPRPDPHHQYQSPAHGPRRVRDPFQHPSAARRDHDAVTASLTLPYSSGPVEGQVNRIKTIKRQMYGRANPDLLANASCWPIDYGFGKRARDSFHSSST